MATIKIDYDTDTALTVTGLATLANGSSATSATIDNSSTQYLDILLEVKVTTGAGATINTWVEVWAKPSIDNTDFSTDFADFWISNISVPVAGAASYRAVLSVAAAFPGGVISPYLQIRLKNSTGAALTAGTVSYMGVVAQSV